MVGKPFESMNVIPFVDIMLVLLTIVLTTSSFIATGKLPIQLPQASKNAAELDKSMVIEVPQSGDLLFNGRTLSLQALKSEAAAISRDQSFIIRADAAVPLQRFIDVADVMKQLNFKKVAVQTRVRQ